MNERRNYAELWTIGFKIILFLYVISQSYASELAITPWYTLAILLYLSVNISFHIFKSQSMHPFLIVLALLVVLAASFYIHPLLFMLLPPNLYELLSLYLRRNWMILSPLLLPMFMLPQEFFIEYGFIAVLTYIYFTMLRTFINRVTSYQEQNEQMHLELDRLTKRISENNEYIRQFEYMFKLEERNRLSQEIHDKIGHSMTGALIQMEAAKRLMTTNQDKSAELLQNAITISKEGIESIRLVLMNVKPTTEQLGINQMRLLLEEFSAKHLVKTVLTHEGNVDLITPLQWKIIQDNTREAFTNTMKYADATAVSLHIEVLSTMIKANVSDNGKGMPKIIKGLGIVGMEERAAVVNGTVIVDGSNGFSVTTLIPYS
ncbi:sensor histidine kinase [Paenibacillus sp. DMB20]|uniref:sensor histidine kinase n=1 Tax=Paenibacillus sp. DMB20 TaxID=1642570 RepID=UPI00062812C4|nr:histidine kinase [Paenibacillus sp. DMB20]KKO55348.1 histidine kinase [Paenibacillus sp. DMB20]